MLTQYPSPSPLLSLPPLIALQSRYYYPTGQESEAMRSNVPMITLPGNGRTGNLGQTI